MRPGRKSDNLPTLCAVVMKYGNLNFLEPFEPVKACNGTALPFHCNLKHLQFLLTYTSSEIRAFTKQRP